MSTTDYTKPRLCTNVGDGETALSLLRSARVEQTSCIIDKLKSVIVTETFGKDFIPKTSFQLKRFEDILTFILPDIWMWRRMLKVSLTEHKK